MIFKEKRTFFDIVRVGLEGAYLLAWKNSTKRGILRRLINTGLQRLTLFLPLCFAGKTASLADNRLGTTIVWEQQSFGNNFTKM